MNNQDHKDSKIIRSDLKNNSNTHRNKHNSEKIQENSRWSKNQSFQRVGAFILFTIISMTIGITTICVILSKQTNKTCRRTFKRTIESITAYNSHPQHVAVADFDRDNNLDLVIANSCVDNIGIRLGYGNGSFANQNIHSTGLGSRPCWVVVGDFNNDTLLDIVVANYGTNNIGLFLGYGNGNFSNQLTFSLGSSRPLSIAVGDFNKNNQSDLVVVNNGTFTVTILLSFGNGSFRIETNYYMGFDSMPSSIAVADFNNDNQLDIATVNYGTSELAVLLATENGTFSIKKYSTGHASHPSSLTIADFNNDHLIDIAIGNSATDNVGVFLGNRNGTFSNIKTFSTKSNSYLRFIVAADFNNDHNLDMIVVDSGENNVIVFGGNGDGTFSIVTTQSTTYNSDPCSIGVGDFDNDNRSDVAVVNSGTNYIIVFISYAFYITTNQTTYSTGAHSYPNSVAVGHFNNDSFLDIAVVNTYANDISIFIGYGNGAFQNQQILSTMDYGYQPNWIDVGDFNNDKQLDIAVAMLGNGVVLIYLGQGDGSFEYGHEFSVGEDLYLNSITSADFNNDGNRDIVTVNYVGDNVAVFLGYGNGTFSTAKYYSTESYSGPIFVCVGDFNSDSLLDLVTVNLDSSTISIFLGNGDGTFQASITISTGAQHPYWIAVGDLNNDSRHDIVVNNPYYSSINILFGYGNGTFTNIYTCFIGIGADSSSFVLGDFNKDTTVDIAVGDAANPSINIFLGRGDGTFDPPYTIPIEGVSYPSCITTGDFNNDNESYIVVGNFDTNDITVIILRYQAIFGNQTTCDQGSGSHPLSITTGDFNNDNQLDIVVANSGNDTIQILMGYNSRTFMNNITYSTGINSHPHFVVTADFNKDSQLDIAVISDWNSVLMIILNSDNGTFNTSTQYSTGFKSFPHSIAIGDFNKDGWIDAVVANSNTDNVGVFLGYDYPTFITHYKILSKRGSFPYYVAVGDFNEDSQWDLAIIYRQIGIIHIFLGNGDGTFRNHSSIDVGHLSDLVSLTIGDFNNDNHSDIAVANLDYFSLLILLGNGNGTFGKNIFQSIYPSYPVFITAADFDDDSRQDLVVANKNDDTVGVFRRYENESFAEYRSYSMPNGSSPVWVVVNDFNQDNILDIAVANQDGNNIGILLGYGDGTFRNVTLYSTGNDSRPCSIAIRDINKDNYVDIAVANTNDQNVGIFFGYGDGTFSSQVTYPTGSESILTSIAIEDLNNDTILDIVVSDVGSENGNIGVLYGLNNGTFLIPKRYLTELNSQPSSIAICDFNNDSQVDFAISYYKKDNVVIMLRDKTEPFGIQTTFSTGNGSSPYSVAVQDFNSDDKLDIAVANFKTNNIGIFLGHGNGSFAKQKTYSTGPFSSPRFIVIGDLNNDKQFDIVVANSNANNIGILFGDGNGTFAIMQTYSTGQSSDPSSVAIGDLNQDNTMDIVVTNSGINTVLVFYGIGNETFSKPISYFFDYDSHPISAAIGDFNNDTWLDIAIANYGPGYVEILLQTC